MNVHVIDFPEPLRGRMDGRCERCQRFIYNQIRNHLSNFSGRIVGKQVCACGIVNGCNSFVLLDLPVSRRFAILILGRKLRVVRAVALHNLRRWIISIRGWAGIDGAWIPSSSNVRPDLTIVAAQRCSRPCQK